MIWGCVSQTALDLVWSFTKTSSLIQLCLQSMAFIKEGTNTAEGVYRLSREKNKCSQTLIVWWTVPALFGAFHSPASPSAAVHLVWPVYGQQRPGGSSLHHSGTLSLSKIMLLWSSHHNKHTPHWKTLMCTILKKKKLSHLKVSLKKLLHDWKLLKLRAVVQQHTFVIKQWTQKAASSPDPHRPTISVASWAAFCSNRSFICLMLNFSVSASFNFLSRAEMTTHIWMFDVYYISGRSIKNIWPPYPIQLGLSVHHSVECRKNKSVTARVCFDILNPEWFAVKHETSERNYLLQVSLDFV